MLISSWKSALVLVFPWQLIPLILKLKFMLQMNPASSTVAHVSWHRKPLKISTHCF